MARGFADALIRHSREVQALEGEKAQEFLRLLKAARDTLAGRLQARGGLGETVDAFHLRYVISETEAGIRVLERKALGFYDDTSQEALGLALEHMGDELDRLSVSFDAKPMDVTIDAAAALADPAQRLLANHFESSVQRYGIDLLNGVRQRLFVALRAGDQVGHVVRDLGSEKGPFGEVGKANAQRLVRTETSSAYGAAQHSGIAQAAKQIPSLKKVWLHVGSWLCPTCGPLHGTERPINGTWTIRNGKRTREVAHPPGHPNCTCRASAMRPTWRAQLEKLGYLGEQKDTAEPGHASL